MPLNPMNSHYSFENPASIYDEEALTALELAGRQGKKINELVQAYNELETETTDKLGKQDQAIQKMNDETMPAKVTAEVKNHINSGAFEDEIDEYMGGLNARVNNMLGSLQTGSTSSDAELIDIRTSQDGESFVNAGESVRKQVGDLRPFTNKPNLIDYKQLDFGYINGDGTVNIYGHGQSDSGRRFEYYTLNYIPVENMAYYHFQLNPTAPIYGDPWVAIACYDSAMNFIRRLDYNQENVRVRFGDHNTNIAYVRISYRSFMSARPKFEKGGYASVLPVMEDHLTRDSLIHEGYLTNVGTIMRASADKQEKTTCFMRVTPFEYYDIINVAHTFPWCGVFFFDASGVALGERFVSYAHLFTVQAPTNSAYMRVSTRTFDLETFAVFNSKDDSELHWIYKKMASHRCTNSNVKGVAHRGLSSVAPENTLHAYRRAKLSGFDYAECDVSFTSDGVPVLLHDGTIDRTSNGQGDITALTYAQASSFDFGSWFDTKFTGTSITTFSDFIRLCRNIGLHPYIELKSGTEEQVAKLVEIVRLAGMSEKVTWISFDLYALQRVKDHAPKDRIGYLVNNITQGVINNANTLKSGSNEVFLDSATWSDEEISICASNGYPLEVWTVNDETTIKNLPTYISGVTTDLVNVEHLLFTNNIA